MSGGEIASSLVILTDSPVEMMQIPKPSKMGSEEEKGMLALNGSVPTFLAGTPFLLEAISSTWPCFRTSQVKVRPAGILRLSCFLSVSVVFTWGRLPREGWPMSPKSMDSAQPPSPGGWPLLTFYSALSSLTSKPTPPPHHEFIH